MNLPRRGFSLIELVIVVVIIGIVAAIAIPRMSRGATGAAASSLTGDLATLRRAIEMYKAEHDNTPPTLANFVANLTLCSTEDGTSSQANRDSTHLFGPYLQSIPPLPVGARKGATGVGSADGDAIGWIYDDVAGTITANCTTETDDAGTLYSSY
ncbi:MAG TPA: prepilin-type N-terminal cleavage/methylation domain-containing protein [Phycisphaerales bacterium]|jgi:general secretion pathway protein G|nr:prepilin-type N-terminal cleavage/methylation domain-containing protein [Phycisphaerales bacterium]